ncbi:MAG: DUF1737 domain-containing protein [Chitinophagaceae bacterium]
MKNIIAYEILEAKTPQELKQYVERHIATGWQPLGGCVIAKTNESQVLLTCLAKIILSTIKQLFSMMTNRFG